MRAREMAPILGTTAQYLPQVLGPMVAAGWLASDPGPKGGYRVVVDLSDHSMLELIELIEGPTDTKTCVLKGGPCGASNLCAVHVPWLEARTALLQKLCQLPVSDSQRKEEEDV